MTLEISPEIFAFIALANGCLSAFFARRRGRNPVAWFLIGAFIGLIGLIILFFLPQLEKKPAVSFSALAPQKPAPLEIALEAPAISAIADWYFIDSDKKTIGPISQDLLEDKWKSGAINANTYVWNDQMSDWKKIQDMPSLKF